MWTWAYPSPTDVSTLKRLSDTPTTLCLNEGAHPAIPREYFLDEFLTKQEAEGMTSIDQVQRQNGKGIWVSRADQLASLELVTLLGKVLPHLETLDLQTRYFRGEEISFLATAELIPLKVSHFGKFDCLAFKKLTRVSHISGSRS